MTTATLEKLKAETGPEVAYSVNRYGYVVDGKRLRRVTTLLGGIPKDALPNWAAKEVAEFAYDNRAHWSELDRTNAVNLLKGAPWAKRDDAADRGLAIHKTVEAWIRKEGMPEGLSADESLCAANAIRFLMARKSKVLGCEITVVNEKIGYAGTFDLWDVVDGESWILDWKSSTGVYPNHAVQQVAYMHAEYALVRKKDGLKPESWTATKIPWGPKRVDRLGIVHVTPEHAALMPVRKDQVKRLWNVFRAAALTKEWLLDTDGSFGKTPRAETFEQPSIYGGDDDGE